MKFIVIKSIYRNGIHMYLHGTFTLKIVVRGTKIVTTYAKNVLLVEITCMLKHVS